MINHHSGTTLLNVDVDLHGDCEVSKLLAAFGDAILPLNQHAGFASFEASSEAKTLEAIVRGSVDIVTRLPPEAKSLWDRCESRCFNIGIQSATNPHAAVFRLSSDAIASVATVGADIAITVYGARIAEDLATQDISN